MNSFNSTKTADGNEGCPCIDTSPDLASLTQQSCITPDGQDGVLLTVAGPCVTHDFGSLRCFPHELNVDLNCIIPEGGNATSIPGYCSRSWCYVDAMACMATYERVYRSQLFPADSGVDVYYSYSTCGADPADWFESTHFALGGVKMKAITAAYNIMPWVYKRNYNGDIPPVPGLEYYDNAMPYEGVHINFVKSLQAVADGDFSVEYVHGSKASRKVHPSSPGTAAVQDVADGLVDIAIGPIWITGGRLKMTSFTMPIHHDRTVLVIPKPGTKSSLITQSEKVLDPFSPGVWALLLATIAVTALLSVWFNMGKRMRGRQSGHVRKRVYARFCIDEFLQKGIFFCSAGVEQDEGASLPHKLLMFGFAFFTLILVSAYVANLAAFLTRSKIEYTGDMESVVAKKMRICAHPALQEDLELAHPDATFVFNLNGKELFGLVEDYKAGSCEVLAVGKMDSLGDMNLMDLFCKEELVYTESLVIENPVGFPIRSDLASGFSYWMYQAEKYHRVSVKTSEEAYKAESKRQPTCDVMLSAQEEEESEFAQITEANLFLPIIFFLFCAGIAVLLQLYHQWLLKKEILDDSVRSSESRSSMLGRTSTLNLFASRRHVGHPLSLKYNFDENDEDKDDAEFQSTQLGKAVSLAQPPLENGHGSNTSLSGTGTKVKRSIAKGMIVSETVDTDEGMVISDKVYIDDDDDFNEDGQDHTTKKKVSFSLFDTPPQTNDIRSIGGPKSAFEDEDVLIKLDEFINCYQTTKRRKQMQSIHG